MRDWRDVFDQLDVQAGRLERRDRAFATRTRSAHTNFDISHAEFRRFLSRLLGGTLTSKRRAFTTSLEPTRAGTGPAQGVALGIRDRDGRVIERCPNVGNATGDIASNSFFLVGLCHSKVSKSGKLDGTEGNGTLGIRDQIRETESTERAATMRHYNHGQIPTGRAGIARTGTAQAGIGRIHSRTNASP